MTDDRITTDDLPEGKILALKYGGKVHLASPGSSAAQCGYWFRQNVNRYTTQSARRSDLCRRCFPST